ncbi:hypothetical protein LOK49_LG15G01046 [Camellia lanceoleosa]|uniref:Uncharacterized protein n=1 Tax=Camellia lanceoleosa TaxID=1840588 RepID=A0ACC0F6X4_9ERIC|nr:hypothetical protein LOK49_LG15G01046 [Camellia lanceoleosa]
MYENNYNIYVSIDPKVQCSSSPSFFISSPKPSADVVIVGEISEILSERWREAAAQGGEQREMERGGDGSHNLTACGSTADLEGEKVEEIGVDDGGRGCSGECGRAREREKARGGR